MKSQILKLIALLTAVGFIDVGCSKTYPTQEEINNGSGCELYGARLKVKPQYAATANYSIIEDIEIKALLTKHGLKMRQSSPSSIEFPEVLLLYDLIPEEIRENRKCYVHEFLSTGKFEIEVNIFTPTFPDKNGAIEIQCYFTGALDPNIVSFALPGIVDAHIIEYLPYPNYGEFPFCSCYR